MVNLRFPNIKGANEREQLKEMQSYLHQLVGELQFALNTIETAGGNSSPVKSQMPVRVVQSSPMATMSLDRGLSDDQATFQAIKPLIIKSADIINAYYEEINRKLESVYLAQSNFGIFAEQTSQEIRETSTSTTQQFENMQVVISDLNTNIGSVRGDLQAVGEEVSYALKDIDDINENIDGINTQVGEIGGSVSDLDYEIKTVGSNMGELIDSAVGQMSDEVGVIDKDLQAVKEGVERNIKDISADIGNLDTKIDDTKNAISSDIDKLKDSLESLNHILIEVNANIKSGLLYYDDNGIPVYGLEIGQKNTINGVEVFNKFARFSAGRLSFYDQNGTEVAYISDYKLYITHAEVTGTLKLGGYLVDTSKGVTFKWVGRS